jgi:hypothetical protein
MVVFFEKRIYWIAILSLLNLVLGLFLFETTVMKKRSRSEQISTYAPGDKVPFIWGQVYGNTKDNKVIIRDFSGGLVQTDFITDDLDINEHVIITGKVGMGRNFLMDKIERFPNHNLKFIVSIVILLTLFWKLIKIIELTPEGLRVSSCK